MHRGLSVAFLFVSASHATQIAVPENEFIQLSIGIVYNIGVGDCFDVCVFWFIILYLCFLSSIRTETQV